uniref:Lysosomal amino acid transporter 1 homolog n=1 Tax=Canis lupus familiaris TaxID=9615 RepID=A0A8C0MSE0_CANLF
MRRGGCSGSHGVGGRRATPRGAGWGTWQGWRGQRRAWRPPPSGGAPRRRGGEEAQDWTRLRSCTPRGRGGQSGVRGDRCTGLRTGGGSPVQWPPRSPRPRPPRMLSDWPSLYMKAVSSSVWPRSRKARTAAALAAASMRRPISMVPSTVAGRAGVPEAARGGDSGRDMAAAAAARSSGAGTPGAQRSAPPATARPTARSMTSAPAHWAPGAPPTRLGAGPREGGADARRPHARAVRSRPSRRRRSYAARGRGHAAPGRGFGSADPGCAVRPQKPGGRRVVARSHGLEEGGLRQLLRLPQRLPPVDMGRVRRMCPGWLGRGQRGPGLDLHSLFCSIHLPPVHQGLQGRQHGPGAVSVVPLGLDRRRLLQPHRLLPGRPAAPAGGSRGGWGVRVGGSWQEHPAPDHCSCRAALVHTLSGPVARLQNEHIKPEGASGVLGTPLSCQGWGGPGGGKVCLRGAGWQVPGTTGRHRIFPAGKASAGTLSSPLSPICPAEARPPPPSVRAVRALRVLRGRGPRRGPRRSGRRGRGSGRLLRAWCPEPRFPQTYTAVYYVLADLLMLSLYFHYKFKKRPSALSAPINAALLVSSGVACGTPLLRRAGPEAAPAEVFRGRTLLSVEPGSKPFTQQEIIGFVIGSVSSVLYLLSRLPQIRTNFLRKSTQGVSYSLFALVMLGNTLYGLSVLLKNPEVGQSEGSYLLHHLPWLVGSLGVLLLDTIISIQFLVYRDTATSSERQPLLPS